VTIRYPLVAAAAIGVGTAFAFALPAGANVGVQSESPSVAAVELGKLATLDANNAVVFMPVKLSCTPGSYTGLGVRVTQNVDGKIASGQAYKEVTPCTGREQSLRVAVPATQVPFGKGVAFGQVQLQVCMGDANCRTVEDEHNVQIVEH